MGGERRERIKDEGEKRRPETRDDMCDSPPLLCSDYPLLLTAFICLS